MRKIILLLITICSVFACSKENNHKWEVSQNTHAPNTKLILKHQDDFNKATEPFDTTFSTIHEVYGEEHELPKSVFRNSKYTKQFILEIIDTFSSFDYWDEEIYTHLNCEVWQHYFNKDDGFYRIHKGHVSGQKIDGQWIIDFNISYGGKGHDKYQMIKNAQYN